jgi:hypothetical protein
MIEIAISAAAYKVLLTTLKDGHPVEFASSLRRS